jgi:hypothetical protein
VFLRNADLETERILAKVGLTLSDCVIELAEDLKGRAAVNFYKHHYFLAIT